MSEMTSQRLQDIHALPSAVEYHEHARPRTTSSTNEELPARQKQMIAVKTRAPAGQKAVIPARVIVKIRAPPTSKKNVLPPSQILPPQPEPEVQEALPNLDTPAAWSFAAIETTTPASSRLVPCSKEEGAETLEQLRAAQPTSKPRPVLKSKSQNVLEVNKPTTPKVNTPTPKQSVPKARRIIPAAKMSRATLTATKRKAGGNNPTNAPATRKTRTETSEKTSEGGKKATVNCIDDSDEEEDSDVEMGDVDQAVATSSGPGPHQDRKNSRQDLRRGLLGQPVAVTVQGFAQKPVRTVHISLALLEEHCPYLHDKITASGKNEIRLLELDSDAFATFSAWLYTQEVDFGPGTQMTADASEIDDGDIIQQVMDCCLLGKKIKVVNFCNAVVSKACAVSKRGGIVFRNDLINKLYRCTKPGFLLRKWIVDEWVFQYDSDCASADEDLAWPDNKGLHPEFVWDVMREQARRLGKKAKEHRPAWGNVKKYQRSKSYHTGGAAQRSLGSS